MTDPGPPDRDASAMSISDFEGAFRQHPGDSERLEAFVAALASANRWQDVLNAIGQARQVTPDLADNRKLLLLEAAGLNMLNRSPEALSLLESAEARWQAEDPQGPMLLQKAIALNAIRQPREALETLERARKSWPDGISTESLLYQTALALISLNEPDQALATLDQLEALADRQLPPGAVAFNRGVAQFQLKRFEQSIESLAQVRGVPPDVEGIAAASMGQALFILGRFDKAEAPLKRAAELARSLPPQHVGLTAYLLGELDVRAGRLEDAIPRLEMAARLDPTLVPASNALVSVLIRLGRLDEARRVNEAALAQASDAPGRAQAQIFRARIEIYEGHTREALDALRAAAQDNPQVQRAPDTVMMEASLLYQLGQLDLAMEALDRADVDKSEDRAWIEIMRGSIFLQRGNLDAALQAWARVTELPDPSTGSRPLRLAKAFAYFNLGDARRAVSLLDEAAGPDVEMNGDYWAMRAMSLFVIDRSGEALEAADRALKILGPHAYAVRAMRAQALTALGQDREAIDEFDRALTDAPRFAPLHIGKGFVLIRQMRVAEALAAFRTGKAAADDINRISAAVGEGLALYLSGEHEEALRVLKENARASDKLPARVPYRWLPRWALGTLYAERERDEEALDAFVRASGLEPDNARIQIDQGCIHARLEDFDAALCCFQAAGRTAEEGEKTRALIGQGGALAKLDLHDDAVAAYRAALGLDPENATVWQGLAETYAADGRHGAALQAFRRAYRLSGPQPSGRRPSTAALGVSAQLLLLERNQDAWQFLDKARHEAESDPKLDFNRGIALTRLRRYREAIGAFRAAKDVAGAADQIEALEARRSRGRSWLDVWFGPDTSLPSRIGGGAILAFIALLMGLMLLNPKEIAGFAWVNTGDAWKAVGVLVLILLLPSASRLKWGEVEIQSLPQEVLPEIHLLPNEPRSALEILVRSTRLTPSPLGSAVSLSKATVEFERNKVLTHRRV